MTKIAKTQHNLLWNQKKYIEQAQKLLHQYNFEAFKNVRDAFDNYNDATSETSDFINLHYEIDFQISLFQLEKGESFSHHDHPSMSGITNVISGELQIKNYNLVSQLNKSRKVILQGEKKTIRKCTIQEVSDKILAPNSFSSLTTTKRNIHSVISNDFTQLVDIFTPAYNSATRPINYNVDESGFYQNKKGLFVAEYEDFTLID
ncbi:hypothetical protein [Aquimarina sp. RZ0]|uniref:hypothetical protein n=1 Tax=Aquimarina sp. RZ0 TaxID=2607730 RepID=UPI00165FC689|nr:hypothetical protein [Aquimarina sp. RZ0]